MLPELAAVLQRWREESPYPREDDWVFASPYTNGEQLYWADSALAKHVRPAAEKAGIRKLIWWHTFQHTFGTLFKAQGEDMKVIQELLRHASQITLETYVQGDLEAKRNALSGISGLSVFARPA